MPSITLTFKLVNTNDTIFRYIGYSYNCPLPSLFWQKDGYVVGLISRAMETVQTSMIVPAGRHYIVFGTSSEDALGYWMDIKIDVSGVTTTQRVHRRQYGYLAFDIGFDGKVTKVIKVDDGTVAPDRSPPVTPSTSGSGGQSISGGGGGVGSTGVTQTVDVGSTIKQMMDTMMPPMIHMMGMMMMMQMMIGMMSSLAGAFAG